MTMKAQWDQISEKLQQKLDAGTYKAWIAPLKGQLEERELTLFASNRFVADWISSRLASIIAMVAEETVGYPVVLNVKTATGQKRSSRPVKAEMHVGSRSNSTPRPVQASFQRIELLSPNSAQPAFSSSSPAPKPAPAPKPSNVSRTVEQLMFTMRAPESPRIVWRHAFENFIVGPCNDMAFAAARNVTLKTSPVGTLFLSSGPGLGKTHLVQAVGKALCEGCNRENPRVEYLTAESFANSFVQAAKQRDFSQFKWRFHEADVLLLEDVHFLQGTEKIQIELLSAIKELQERGRRVVLTSSFSPRELNNVDSSLVSRFTSGFLACLEKPDRETRLRMLFDKAKQQNAVLPDDVAELLAERLSGDVRQLESCLHNLLLRARILNSPTTVDMAFEVLSQYALESPFFSLDAITRLVCEAFNLRSEQLAARSRKANLVLARNTIFYLARKHTDLSLEAIGEHFCRKHSTVLKGIASVERELSRETTVGRQLATTLDRIEKRCR